MRGLHAPGLLSGKHSTQLAAPASLIFFFSSRRRHTRSLRDWSSDVCSSDLEARDQALAAAVYDMKGYAAADFAFGQRYADAVSIDEQKRTIADLGRISLLEPDRHALSSSSQTG